MTWELVLTPPAVRAVQTDLPESVAAAVIEFMVGPLVENPHRVGKPLKRELAGIWSARRGTYRILYRINEQAREVVVLRIDHRRDVYLSLNRVRPAIEGFVQYYPERTKRVHPGRNRGQKSPKRTKRGVAAPKAQRCSNSAASSSV